MIGEKVGMSGSPIPILIISTPLEIAIAFFSSILAKRYGGIKSRRLDLGTCIWVTMIQAKILSDFLFVMLKIYRQKKYYVDTIFLLS
jgi:hypothetical protein